MSDYVCLPKGKIETALSAAAATSTSQAFRVADNNSVLIKVEVTGSGNWDIEVLGAFKTDETFVNIYDNNGTQLKRAAITASVMFWVAGLPDYIKIKATENSGTATVTVKIQSFTI
jgi:hypothetical protein